MPVQATKTNIKYIALTTLVMALVWSITAGVFMGMVGAVDMAAVEPMESVMSSLSLLAVSILNVLLIAWFVNRTRLSGFRLGVQVFVMLFGVMFFMTQIETLMFNRAIAMPAEVLLATVSSGFLVALSVAGMAVLHRRALGRVVRRAMHVNTQRNITKLLMLGIIYMIFYFFFGYYTAWQVPELREFYSGSSEIIPFADHMLALVWRDSALPVFQIMRGLLWVGIAYSVIAALGPMRTWERLAMVGLAISIPLATPLFVPNEFMPPLIREAHFYELMIENFLFGVLVALFFRPRVK